MRKFDQVHLYGVDERALCKIGADAIEAFIKRHDPTMYQEILDICAESFIDAADKYSDDLDEAGHDKGHLATVAQIIGQETGIRFSYCRSSKTLYEPECIGFRECQPWELNAKERELNEEEIKRLITPYLVELGVKPNDIFFGYYTTTIIDY